MCCERRVGAIVGGMAEVGAADGEGEEASG
jgi:hypothetical protein